MRCEACGVSVKDENLRRHYTSVHPKLIPPKSSPQQRRQKRPLTRNMKRALGVVSAGVAALVVLAVLLQGVPVSNNGFPFPCTDMSNLVYHWHPTLTITDSSGNVVILANIGISGACMEPLHTHDTSGTVHVEASVNRLYTVGDFFSVWKKPFGGPTQMLVNGTAVSPLPSQMLWDRETISLTYSGAFP